MKPGNHERPAEDSLRRPINAKLTAQSGCAAAVVFGALNLLGALVTNSYGVLEVLALVTIVAGAAGLAGYRAGAVWTFAAMAIYLLFLLAVGLAISFGQAVTFTSPDWLEVDYRFVLLIAGAWCAACLLALYSAMRWQRWEGYSGTK